MFQKKRYTKIRDWINFITLLFEDFETIDG